MLRPRKDPLIDGPLRVSTGRQLRRWRIASLALAATVVALWLAWPETRQGKEVPDEVWWRRLVSSIAMQRFVRDVDASAAEEMKQRITRLEAERMSLAERLAEADKVLKIDRSQQRLSQVVARQEGSEIAFEVLLRTPTGETPGTRLSIDVSAIRNPQPDPSVARASTLTLDVERQTRMAVTSPRVAETFQGRLAATASHLLVMVSVAGNASQTEALLVPVNGNK
jgi:hypothetical protein